jgi:hypothetical protein
MAPNNGAKRSTEESLGPRVKRAQRNLREIERKIADFIPQAEERSDQPGEWQQDFHRMTEPFPAQLPTRPSRRTVKP